MTELSQGKRLLPLKSVAVALLFSVFFGPVGLLYASVLGGVLLIVLSIIVLSNHFFILMSFIWLVSCVWSVVAANRYNQKILLSS